MRASTPTEPDLVESGSDEDRIIEEELDLLARVQRGLAEREIKQFTAGQYDRELLELRDQISEARAEDVAPLVTEMYRLQALGARTGEGRTLPVDAQSPYFGHLVLREGDRVRNVLIGNSGFVPSGRRTEFAIVDWRHAPVSKIYYRYSEGDDFEEDFGGRMSTGEVLSRRTISIQNGELRRVTWSEGSVARRGDGKWIRLSQGRPPTLEGGAGLAVRPTRVTTGGASSLLGVVGDESLREDKRLQAITGLIDKQQFDLITKPDAGIVILQGGAGSGKTTVALHRAAYLHYQDPKVFNASKMMVVVKSPALTAYIAEVLPSLGVSGIRVVTLESWMRKTRAKVLPELQRPIVDDVPPGVSRVKKHPGVMKLLERAISEEAQLVGEQMLEKLSGKVEQTAIRDKWRGMASRALVPRIREMERWLGGAASSRAGVSHADKRVVGGVLRRARQNAMDVESAWATVLTDASWLAEALGLPADHSDIRETVAWVGQQSEEVEVLEPDEDEDEREPLVSDNSVSGKFDIHDDALLLRLVQLRFGSLPIAGSQRTISYEHVVVDEAQDLSPTDVAVLRGALTRRESMTLAGDTAQKLVFDNSFTDWKGLLRDLGISGTEIEPLRITYRSTKEVLGLAQHVLGPLADPEPPIAPRSGAPVEMFSFSTTGEAIAMLGEALRSLIIRERKASVAIITRYAAQANIYYEGLKNSEVPALRRVYGTEFTFDAGVDVVDVGQVKGLEYDYVILPEVNQSSYPESIEARHLLHIAATRAVYQLWVSSVGIPSPLLPESA